MTDARSLTLELGGRWRGRSGLAPCPICQPQRRRDQHGLSLTERNGRLLLKCHKGHCAFPDLLAALNVPRERVAPPDPLTEARWQAEEEAEAEKRSRCARRVWDETQPISGTPGEAYLRSRGIIPPSS